MYMRDVFEKSFLNVFNGVRFNGFADLYAGLLLTDPGDAGNPMEPTYAGYERVKIEWTVPGFDATLNAFCMKNSGEILFPKSSQDAGTASYIGIFEGQTVGGGALQAYVPIETPIEIKSGLAPKIFPNEMVLRLVSSLTDTWKRKLFDVMRGVSIDPVTPYMALYHDASELTGDNYVRQRATFGEPANNAQGTMEIYNTSKVQFPPPTTAWGRYNAFGVMTAGTGGELVYNKPRGSDVTVTKQFVVEFEVGDIRITAG